MPRYSKGKIGPRRKSHQPKPNEQDNPNPTVAIPEIIEQEPQPGPSGTQSQTQPQNFPNDPLPGPSGTQPFPQPQYPADDTVPGPSGIQVSGSAPKKHANRNKWKNVAPSRSGTRSSKTPIPTPNNNPEQRIPQPLPEPFNINPEAPPSHQNHEPVPGPSGIQVSGSTPKKTANRNKWKNVAPSRSGTRSSNTPIPTPNNNPEQPIPHPVLEPINVPIDPPAPIEVAFGGTHSLEDADQPMEVILPASQEANAAHPRDIQAVPMEIEEGNEIMPNFVPQDMEVDAVASRDVPDEHHDQMNVLMDDGNVVFPNQVEGPLNFQQYLNNEEELEYFHLLIDDDYLLPPQQQEIPVNAVVARNLPLARRAILNEEDTPVHSLGLLNVSCQSCSALFFAAELPNYMNIGEVNGTEHCCKNSGILTQIAPLRDMPHELRNLYERRDDYHYAEFMKDIRSYNSSLAFVSFGADYQMINPTRREMGSVFRLHGAIHHRISHLHPNEGTNPSFGQLYIVDSAQANEIRLQNRPLDPLILARLDQIIRQENPYCAAYNMLHEVERAQRAQVPNNAPEPHVYMVLMNRRDANRRNDGRNIERIAGNEVAAVYVCRDGAPPRDMQLAVYPRDLPAEFRVQNIRTVSQLNQNLDPMTYPLLFPRGDFGWSPQLRVRKPNGSEHKVTLREYYNYRLALRPGFNPLLSAGKLTQQYIVDGYVKAESDRLTYIRQNQGRLRTELYTGLMDHIDNRANREGAAVGRMVILPSSFIGGARNMQQLYQDAMAIVREIGRPDLFITFTANPMWPEIQDNLNGHKYCDRPDIIDRVFHSKLKAFVHDLIVNKVFGSVKGFVYTIEFQKRSLPHCHMLIVLENQFKPRCSQVIDQITCAEIPDPISHPRLHQCITGMMIHNPCGELNRRAPCMENGRCSKGFPKDFQETTNVRDNGYPVYRRRDDGRNVVKNGIELDNRWVVPYNPYLTLKYSCHINVEICTGIQGVKYIYKYIYKGVDAARVLVLQRDQQIQQEAVINWDEAQGYIDARYVSAAEAVWRLRAFPLHEHSHQVIRLQVHTEGQQAVVFVEGEEERALNERGQSMLTAWFALNEAHPEHRIHKYTDIPHHFRYDPTRGWYARARRERKPIVVRMYNVSPRDVERFHLRILLNHVRGATSFESLRTFEGTVYDTFLEAARARNLTRQEEEWRRCLEEAATYQMPRQLRLLFASMLVYCELGNYVLDLWEEFKDSMSEDYARNHVAHRYDMAKRDIERTLRANNVTLDQFGLQFDEGNLPPNLIDNDEGFDQVREAANAERDQARLNPDQLAVFNRVVEAIYNPRPNHSTAFLLEGAAGTGKTFLYNTLLAKVRGNGDTAIATAFTGIAAILLSGGTTMNYAFGFPLEVNERSVSRYAVGSPQAGKVRDARLIILDEVTMMSKHHIKCLNLFLQDVTGRRNQLFGGKVILFGGDFRQTLPVVPRASRPTICSTTIKSSQEYRELERFRLNINMRAAPEEVEYVRFLLRVGNGTEIAHGVQPSDPNDRLIEVPPQSVTQDLIREVYGDVITGERAQEYVQTAILCPKNVDIAEVNRQVLERLQSEERVYYSVDSVADSEEAEALNVPQEYLNSLNPSGMPPYELRMKVGCVVMLLRNINVTRGLVNGTRLKILRLGNNHVEAQVLTGSDALNNERIFLSRFEMTETNSPLPFSLKRRQFPLKVSYAMTINKSQGQTLSRVGLLLPQPVFSHGQLYVALSRARSLANVKIQVENGQRQGELNSEQGDHRVFTPNVVWTEILRDGL